MLICSIRFSAPSFGMGGGLENRCVSRVYGADGAVRHTAPSAPYTRPAAAALKTTTFPKTRCRKPYAATQHLMLLMMGVSHGTIRTAHTTFAAVLKTTTHPKTRCRKPYAATQHQMLLMMGVCTRNMSS